MKTIKTAIGRLIPFYERHTNLEDSILFFLYNYKNNKQNPNNEPAKLCDIIYAMNEHPQLVIAAVNTLHKIAVPLIELKELIVEEKTYAINNNGISFVSQFYEKN